MPATYVDPFGMTLTPAEWAAVQADLAAAWQPPVLLDSDLVLFEETDENGEPW